MGARKVATIQRQLSQPQIQPEPEKDPETGLEDAGTWSVSASWAVPSNATSGIYFAKLVRQDSEPGSNHIVFVVRDDNGASDLLFQTSDTTWQAYNKWGGNSLYSGQPAGRAFKVSYNRPITTRTVSGGMGESNFVFWAEYPMVRWLEMNGYDVSYTTNVDTARRGAEILEHDAFLSVGHDEYWSAEMRSNVEAARSAGVNLAFFSGNEVYWKVRWEDSIDGNGTPYRTLVCYKESVIGASSQGLPPDIIVGFEGEDNVEDPSPIWTGLWRDMRFSPPGDAMVEQLLTGQAFSVNRGPGGMTGTSIQVPSADGKMRFWRNTSVAALGPGQVAVLSNGTLGYEWDEDPDTGFRPAGAIRLSSTTEFVPEKLLDPLTWPGCEGIPGSPCSLCRGCMVAPGTATHNMTMFRDPVSKAIVFGAGTVQWSWGLDGNHDGTVTVPDPRMQQATVNLFADMGVQPETLQANLVPASATTDTVAPISIITSPTGGLIVQSGSTPITITGTASDSGGQVGGIEISVDGGQTWRRADGRESWSYSWIPNVSGAVNIRTRATDDSVNTETPGAGIVVTVVPDNVTAPQISNVAGLVVNNQTATITWTTDEASDSRVIYGTSPSNLNQSAFVAAMVTSHSVTLNNLAPNTNFYYRVVSEDEFNNEAISPVPPEQPLQISTPAFTDTTLADFGAGTLGAGISQADAGDGSLILLPTAQAEFLGGSIPPNWTATPYIGGGNVSVSGGVATIEAARLNTNSLFGPGRALEFTANFGGAAFQHIGFANDFAQPLWAMFSTGEAGGQLFARTANGPNQIDTLIPGNWFGANHRYRVDWSSSVIRYYIDDVQVATHAVNVGASMRPVASDLSLGFAPLTVDWIRMGAYSTTGTYSSRIFDATSPVVWTRVTWIADLPAGTNVVASVRMGNSPVPDENWTDFIPIATSGTTIGGGSRYLQYRVELTTTDTNHSPILHNLALSYSTSDTVPPTVTSRTPAPSATDVAPLTSIVAKFSELMNASTFNTSTMRLRPVGGSSDVPATVSLVGSTATLSPLAPLSPETSYTATVSGSVADTAGNPLGADVTWTFTTGWLAFRDETVAEFGAGDTGAGTIVTATHDGEITLAAQAGAELNGTSLPSDWFSQTLGGSVSVGDGVLTADGALAGLSAFYSPGQTLEFVATFTGDAFQHVGFGVNFNSMPWAIFSTSSGGSLRARTNGTETILSNVAHGVPHLFRIEWTSTAVSYYVDGAQVATHGVAIGASMRPMASDAAAGGGAVTVDWLRLLPYAEEGTFLSRVFDAGQQVAWDDALYTSSVPAGASLLMSVRVGNTPTPDASWTNFISLPGSDMSLGLSSRYAQYRAQLERGSAGETNTPSLEKVELRYSDQVADSTPPSVIARTPAVNSVDVALDTDVVVDFNDLLNPATVNTSSFRLRAAGASQDVAATIQVQGSRATLLPNADLDATTTYQVTIAGTVADQSGNAMGTSVQWSFTTESLRVRDTTAADFGAGSANGAAVTSVEDGEVILAPQLSESFAGATVPTGWTSSPWGAGGDTTLSNGQAAVDGSLLSSTALFQAGSTVEFTATLTGAPNQHIGFGTNLSGSPWAIFSTKTGGALYARTSSVGDTLIPGGWFSAPHRFRIEWTAASIQYFIDGSLVASHSASMSSSMRALASDASAGGGVVSVDEVSVTPYASTGTFTSRVFDGGSTVTWEQASWTAQTPSGTTLEISVRMGSTPVPDSSWTAFTPLSSSGAMIGGSSRYLQYRASMTTSNNQQTPTLEEFTVVYSDNPDTIAPTVVSRSPAPGATDVALNAPVQATFSEPLDAATVNAATVRLRATGSSTDVPAVVTLSGGTITLQPSLALSGNTVYQATVASGVKDVAGNPLAADVQWSFTTGSGLWVQTSAAEFSAGAHQSTAVVDGAGGEVQLATAFTDGFSGTALGPQWTVGAWGGSPTVTVSGGTLKVTGAQVLTTGTFADRPLLGRVQFGAAKFQHFGLATSLATVSGNYWAIFSTSNTTNTLFARVNASGTTQDVNLGALPAGFHDYRIVPTGTSFQFYVDGVLRTTIAIAFPAATPVRVAVSSVTGVLEVDTVTIESYAASGEFLSAVFDASRVATWGTVNWTAAVPAGTTMIVETRSGNTAAPDGTWSAWAAASNGSTVTSPAGRYLQYRVRFTTSAPNSTPQLLDISFGWM
jgi:hypothetical protein